MLQDLEFGRLENEYYNITAKAGDSILCFNESQVLLFRGEDGTLKLPTLADLTALQDYGSTRYAFRINGQNYFLWFSASAFPQAAGFTYEPVRHLRQLEHKEIC